MNTWMGAAAGVAILATGMAVAQDRPRMPSECRQQMIQLCRGAEGGFGQCLRTVLPKLSDECRKAMSDRAMARQKTPDGMIEIAYGSDPKQRMDLAVPDGGGKAPILFFVHGGGWSIGDKVAGESSKAPWATGQGWAFVSANYRLVPQATVEQQAADLATALAWLRAHANEKGLDPNRIVLMGHSAGAHLVALLGTDERYLKAAGVPLSAVTGVVLLDGAGYNVPKQGSAETNIVKPMYDAAFSTDPKRQAALSPTSYTAQPNVASWLILPIDRRPDSLAQSRELSDALVKAGNRSNVTPIPDKSHGGLNKAIGEDGDYATGLIEKFLAGLR